MSSDNKPLTKEELNDLGNRVLNYFGGREQLQYYWKTTIGNEINELATSEFGISLHRMKQVVLGVLQIEDKTKEDVKLLKQKAWEVRPAYTQEQVDTMYAKRKETCQRLYGVDNVFQSEEIKEKLRETCLQRYGAYNINSLEANKQAKSEYAKQRTKAERKVIREKCIHTNMKKYAVANPFQNSDIKAKCAETKLQRYGDVNYNNRAKAQDTCLERYGSEHFSQTQDALSAIKFRKYCIDDISFDSYPELAVYLYCIHNNISIQRNPVRLEYEFENKKHFCFPDFLIDKTLVEIKGDHLYKKMLAPDTVENAKLNCLTTHNVELWTIDKYKPYIVWFETNGFNKEDYLVRR